MVNEHLFYGLYENHTTNPNDYHDERFWKVTWPGYYKCLAPGKEKTGMSIIIVPGGAYAKLNPIYNGLQYAKFFASHGIDAYVLIHRLPDGNGLSAAIADLKSMIYIVSNNSDGGIIGLMGCSAGGHLCATVANQTSSVVDFCVLMSPVISFDPLVIDTDAETRTKNNAISDLSSVNPDAWRDFSIERMINPFCCPTIIFQSQLDDKVSCRQSTLYFHALDDKNIRCALHIYSGCQHDFKIKGNTDGIESDQWSDTLLKWIEAYISR
jgi:acetyl esterase/lipase